MILIVRGHINNISHQYRVSWHRSTSEFDLADPLERDGTDSVCSQEEFADVCGLDRTYMGGIERGEHNLSLINMEKIAEGFEISFE